MFNPQESGWTALHIASQNGKKDVVQALLINGADIDLQSSKPDRVNVHVHLYIYLDDLFCYIYIE